MLNFPNRDLQMSFLNFLGAILTLRIKKFVLIVKLKNQRRLDIASFAKGASLNMTSTALC